MVRFLCLTLDSSLLSIFRQLHEATEGQAGPADEGGRGEGQAVEAEAGARGHAAQAERTEAAVPGELPPSFTRIRLVELET